MEIPGVRSFVGKETKKKLLLLGTGQLFQFVWLLEFIKQFGLECTACYNLLLH